MPDATQGNASEGVQVIRHPRSDWPQDGWISYVERALNVPKYQAPYMEYERSFRSVDRRVAQTKRYYYSGDQDVQMGYIPFKVPVTNAIVKNDWHQDTVRTPSPREAFAKARQSYHPHDVEQWWTTFEPATDAAIAKQDWHIDTTQTVNRRTSPFPWHAWRTGFEPIDWITVQLQPSTNPAIQDWHTDTVVTPDRRLGQKRTSALTNPDAQQMWWTSFPTVASGIATDDWIQKTDLTPRPNGQLTERLFYDPAHEDTSWLANILVQVFDPSTMTWDQPSVITPKHAHLLMQHNLDLSAMAWLHDVIPLTDPVTGATVYLRPIAPIMAARRRRRR